MGVVPGTIGGCGTYQENGEITAEIGRGRRWPPRMGMCHSGRSPHTIEHAGSGLRGVFVFPGACGIRAPSHRTTAHTTPSGYSWTYAVHLRPG